MLTVQYSGNMKSLFTKEHRNQLQQIHQNIYEKKGEGSDFLGWVDAPSKTNEELVNQLIETAETIRKQSQVLIVIGIGGSYLGARAVIEAMNPYFQKNDVEVLFAGHQVSGAYLKELIEYIDDKDVSLNVISKSGTTTEPAMAFRFLQKYMEERYGDEASSRIFATTDAEKGALLKVAEEKGYKRFVVPDDIGGRYSVFTPVGLLPIAVAGYDIKTLLAGAKDAEKELEETLLEDNPAIQYATIRHSMYEDGLTNEVFASFEPKLHYIQEWWKQLFGESEGKDGKGIFPVSVTYTTDLHSLGQYIQDGKRNLFETFLMVDQVDEDLNLISSETDEDQLNYIAGLSLHEFNEVAYKGTSEAHLSGGVPQVTIRLPKIDEYNIGYLLYFYMLTCAYSGYLLGVNPFDQPGVEAYKTNIFKLLKKPGY
ncbi:glucose-6-phosphate isomerase [Halalkalibacillus sediminis]|uniref:Glucose-6-phosphate isomerase n=1 Tax=Halalkalibacillus sediminis TaxID=2018042 RepID=A0A2I0QUC2_9BACI|nr:glucose-6-phosphate isomerase [Halalkalibacillus sediminis]PKR77909.1 glucose-6-phosphate isomerase [Halalkalibacillus sediminis]